MTDQPQMIPMYPVRRGVAVLGSDHDEEGRPALTVACDCGATTVLVFEIDQARPGTQEVAFTCDGCLSAHWITFTVRDGGTT